MANESNNKDVANSLSKYSDFANKGINASLDTANQINKWYQNEHLRSYPHLYKK